MPTLLLAIKALAFLAVSSSVLAAPSVEKRQEEADYHWVPTWTSMPQLVESNNLPPQPFTGGSQFQDATLRQTLHMSIGADRIRVQISNTFGGSDLPITEASLALPQGGGVGVAGIDTATLQPLTFDGKASVSIPRGQVAYSDPIDFRVGPQSMLTVSLYLQGGQQGNSITGHPGSRTTSWMSNGNHVNDESISGGNTKHWYFVSGVEAWSPPSTKALIILGDSITDGRGSDDDKNNRWPDLVLKRMQAEGITDVAVCNQAAGGNAMLSGGLGPTLQTRYRRDAIEQPGVGWVMVFEGVNDLGNTPDGSAPQLATRIIGLYQTIIKEAKAKGYQTIGATITPFNGQGQSYSGQGRERARVQINEWIMTSGEFDLAVDFSASIGNGQQLMPQYDGGDHLHPNVAGYQKIADDFPIDFFRYKNGSHV